MVFGSMSGGSIAGVVGELVADSFYQGGTGTFGNTNQARQIAVSAGGLSGSVASLFTSIALGDDDNKIAKNINTGNFLATNAGANNATYINKKGKVIASDQINDHKIILVDQLEEKNIFNQYLENHLIQKTLLNPNEIITEVAIINPNYQQQTNGKIYNLTKKSDFTKLVSLSGEYGMTYSNQTLDLIFNNSTTNNMTNIFFINGMDNNLKLANDSANLIAKLTNQEVGLITNKTAGIVGDVMEYLPLNLSIRDVLNAEVLSQIANHNNHNNNKSLVILHSAGNEDLYKASQILNFNQVNLNNNIDFISVGSSISASKLQNSLTPIGGNLLKQYNNILDPVTNSKTWAIGAGSLFVAGAVYGASAGINSTMTGTGLEAFFTGLIGGGIGGGIGISGLKLQHPFATYLNKDFKGLATDIETWSKENKINK